MGKTFQSLMQSDYACCFSEPSLKVYNALTKYKISKMKNYKRFLSGIPVLIFVLALSQASHPKKSLSSGQPVSDPVATHNMLVIGETAVYLYHLPMFQQKGQPLMPHRYQVILEADFDKEGSNAREDYTKDRQSHPGIKIYTISPEPFILPTLVSSDLQQGSLRKFRGTVFRGHLEKGGSSILPDIGVNVKGLVYFHKFDAGAERPVQLEYLLFGKGQELFLAHLVTGPPDFDQVLSITIAGHTFSDEELAKGIKVVIPHTVNSPSTRLKEKQQVEGALKTGTALTPQKIQVVINREFYFEEGELRIPPKFDTTPAEKKAGFP